MTAQAKARLGLARRREQAAWWLQLERFIEEAPSDTPAYLRLGTGTDQDFPLPAEAVALLRNFASLERRGLGASLVPRNRTLTTREAAEILNVSRPWVVKLIDRGDIEHEMVGNRRRVTLENVLEYKGVRDAERRAGLARLAQMDREDGFLEG